MTSLEAEAFTLTVRKRSFRLVRVVLPVVQVNQRAADTALPVVEAQPGSEASECGSRNPTVRMPNSY